MKEESPLKELSPRELNRMFRQLYAEVPYKYPSFLNSHIDEETVWPLAENCRKRFKELIKFAHITNAFHDFLEHDFINYTDYETGGLNDNLSQVHSLLDLSVPDSGGVFDSVRVKEIERLAYLEKTKYFLIILQLIVVNLIQTFGVSYLSEDSADGTMNISLNTEMNHRLDCVVWIRRSVGDENRIAQLGIPVITVGPDGGNAHEANEWVSKRSILALESFFKSIFLD